MSLTTTFTLQDNVSNKIGNIIVKVNSLGTSMGKLEEHTNKITSAINRSVNSSSKVTRGIGYVNNSLIHLMEQAKITNAQIVKLFERLERPPKTPPENKVLGWFSKISKLASAIFGVYVTIKGFKYAFDFADNVINVDARLNFITNGEEEKTKMKNTMMRVSNELGTSYLNFSDQVIKMRSLTGNTFSSNSEVIRFNELLAKSFRIAGTGSEEASAAMYQLNQAMASGRLQGDEFRAILENAPMLAQAIAKDMKVSFGEIKKLSSEGKITADVIKSALFNMGDELDTKFSQLPRTWGQVFNILQNKVFEVSQNLLNLFNKIASNDTFMKLIDKIVYAIGVLAKISTFAFEQIGNAISTVVDVFSSLYNSLNFLKPVLYTLIGLFVVYKGLIFLTTTYTALMTAGTAALTVAKIAWNFILGIINGQLSLMNSLLAISPIGWIAALIVSVIVVLKILIHYVNKFFNVYFTLTGLLVGTITAALAIIVNAFIFIVNIVIKYLNKLFNLGSVIAEVIYKMFTSPMDSIKNFILDTVNFTLSGIKKITSVADKILGTNYTSKISSLQDKLESKKTYIPDSGYFNKRNPLKEMEYFNIKDSFNFGNKMGEGIVNKVKGFFSLDEKGEELGDDGSETNNLLKSIDKNTKDTKDNTKEFTEDLKLLRDMAHREYVAEVTSPTINIEVSNNNHINTEEDKQDFIQTLTNQISLAVLGGARKGVVK